MTVELLTPAQRFSDLRDGTELYADPDEDTPDPGWLAKGGLLLAATSALTVGVAAAATVVDEDGSDTMAAPEPAVGEPAPPVDPDEIEAAPFLGAATPPELLAFTTTPSAAPLATPTAVPLPEAAAPASTVDPAVIAAADAVARQAEAEAATRAEAESAAVRALAEAEAQVEAQAGAEAAAQAAAAAEAEAAAAAQSAQGAAAPAPAAEATGRAAADVQSVQVAAATAPASTSFSTAAESEFLALTNQARAAVGAGGVVRNATLDEYARTHAATMVQAGQIHHSNIAALLGPFSVVGENVGTGPAVGNIQTALVQSPTHYANMVDPTFTSMGVGTIVDGGGTVWTVHVFGA